MTPAKLPQPICNLNAISANQASQLEFAFRTIQNAVGVKGTLRTDFDSLAQNVIAFERNYTLGATVSDFLKCLGGDMRELIQHCESLPSRTQKITLELGFVPTELVEKIKKYQENELSGRIQLNTKNPGLSFETNGAVNGAEASVVIDIDLILDFKAMLSV